VISIFYRSLLIASLFGCNCAIAIEIANSDKASKFLAKISDRIPTDINTGLVKYFVYSDSVGEHVLFVRKITSQSKIKFHENEKSRHEIDVKNFLIMSNGTLQLEWSIIDTNDCPGLDSDADYFLDKISITDVDGDGKAEATIPYYMFCGGGIDPNVIKIIMRTGPQKFAIRGESKVVYSGQEPFGGNFKLDRNLNDSKNSKFKKHILSVWESVYIDKR